MPPRPIHSLHALILCALIRYAAPAAVPSPYPSQQVAQPIKTQWRNPSDVLTVLLIIGGDVVLQALAQLTGGYFVPITLSFGWVTYAFAALTSAVGDGKLMPSSPDHPSILVNSKTGYTRENRSWVLGRVLRNHESRIEAKWEKRNLEETPSLSVTFFRSSWPAGKPDRDAVWYSGLAVMIVQFGIAAIPWGVNGNWGIFMITACGTLLALAQAALPQWRAEKWSSRVQSKPKTVALTCGNGGRHVMVITCEAGGPNLEDLAGGWSKGKRGTRGITGILAAAWIVFLITVQGIRYGAWYLLGIGVLGMIHSAVIAGAARSPGALGIHLVQDEFIEDGKVMDALKRTDEKFLGVGLSLVEVYFPGKLNPEEEAYWNGRKAMLAQKRGGSKSQGSEKPSGDPNSSTVILQPVPDAVHAVTEAAPSLSQH